MAFTKYAGVLKYSFIVMTLLVGHSCFCQYGRDTCLTGKQLHDYNRKIYHYKDLSYVQQFQIRMLTELKRIDTVSNTSEKIDIHYIAKNDSLLRKVRIWYKGGCVQDSTVTHFNKEGLVAYIENWENNCGSTKNSLKSSISKISHRRYEYDSQGRRTKLVFTGPEPKSYRVFYSYDRDSGEKHETSFRINEYEFWD